MCVLGFFFFKSQLLMRHSAGSRRKRRSTPEDLRIITRLHSSSLFIHQSKNWWQLNHKNPVSHSIWKQRRSKKAIIWVSRLIRWLVTSKATITPSSETDWRRKWNHHLKEGLEVDMISHDHWLNPVVPHPTWLEGVKSSFMEWSEEVIAFLAVKDDQELISLLTAAASSKDVIEKRMCSKVSSPTSWKRARQRPTIKSKGSRSSKSSGWQQASRSTGSQQRDSRPCDRNHVTQRQTRSEKLKSDESRLLSAMHSSSCDFMRPKSHGQKNHADFKLRLRRSHWTGDLVPNDSSIRRVITHQDGLIAQADHVTCWVDHREVKGCSSALLSSVGTHLSLKSSMAKKFADAIKITLALQNVRGNLAQSLNVNASDTWSQLHSLDSKLESKWSKKVTKERQRQSRCHVCSNSGHQTHQRWRNQSSTQSSQTSTSQPSNQNQSSRQVYSISEYPQDHPTQTLQPITSPFFSISDRLFNNNAKSQNVALLQDAMGQCVYSTSPWPSVGVQWSPTQHQSLHSAFHITDTDRWDRLTIFLIPLVLAYLSIFKTPGQHSSTPERSLHLPRHHCTSCSSFRALRSVEGVNSGKTEILGQRRSRTSLTRLSWTSPFSLWKMSWIPSLV